jgi:hypothetical protein
MRLFKQRGEETMFILFLVICHVLHALFVCMLEFGYVTML